MYNENTVEQDRKANYVALTAARETWPTTSVLLFDVTE